MEEKSKPSAPLLLIYRFDLSAPDGTSVQLRRMFAGFSRPLVHVSQIAADTKLAAFALPGVANVRLADPEWPFRPGGRFVLRWWRRLIAPLCLRLQYQKMVGSATARGGLAYVVVLDEESAAFACRVLNTLRPRTYVLHLMDLFSDEGLVPDRQPHLTRLIREAGHVRCVSPVLGREIAKVRPDPVEIPQLIPAHEVYVEPVSGAAPIALSAGSLYAADPRKLAFFQGCFFPAWQEFLDLVPTAKLVYCGADHAAFSPEARPLIEDLGILRDDDYYRQLRAARCAVLPISHQLDDAFRFSVVSRLMDYFTAGLPVIADRAPGTGTGEFLAQFEGRGAILVQTKAEALAALRRLFIDHEFHRAQSLAGLKLAANLFSPKEIRDRLEQVLGGL